MLCFYFSTTSGEFSNSGAYSVQLPNRSINYLTNSFCFICYLFIFVQYAKLILIYRILFLFI